MLALSRKQREIQEREELILGAARDLLLERGYLGLTMDRIAEAVEYSKGTVYQHFRCKEDILVALAAQTKAKRAELFERAATFRGSSRERITAIGVADELFMLSYPLHYRTEKLVLLASIQSKVAAERLRAAADCDLRCFNAVVGIVRDAIAQGDLILPDDVTPPDVVFALWSVSFGARLMMHTESATPLFGIENPGRSLELGQNVIMDGYCWKPLSRELDLKGIQERVRREVFAEESRRAGLR